MSALSSFSAAKHGHVEAAVLASLLTLLTYAVKWCFGIHFPVRLFAIPTFLVIFAGTYTVSYVFFLMLWMKR